MKIILDAMGGDHAPEAAVLGALDAVKAFNTQVTLVGHGEQILEVLKKHGYQDLPAGVEVANADDVVDMHDDPATVLHKRKGSSMVVGLKALADGQGDAFVSAGSTGALLTAATLVVKRVKGIRRAAMAPAIPNKAGGKTIIVDCGANAECTPKFLMQFALVGSLYAKQVLGVPQPKVGLLNIGAEDSKGTPLQLAAYQLLKQAGGSGRDPLCRQCGGKRCTSGGCGCGGLRRILRQCAAEGHRGHRYVHGLHGEADVQGQCVFHAGCGAVQEGTA